MHCAMICRGDSDSVTYDRVNCRVSLVILSHNEFKSKTNFSFSIALVFKEFFRESESRFAKSCHEPKVVQISAERIERCEGGAGRRREPKGETLAEVRLTRPE